ncbi:MAG: heme-binding protein [Hyphomicrobiales bacterium]|nr:heme-binding protein [Hyphomicrobiales bacterium]
MSELTLAQAQAALEAVTEAAAERGKAVVVAVCDRHGELLAFARMASGLLASITIAQNKAYTAARLNRATRVLGERYSAGGAFVYFGDSRLTGFAGGLPVVLNGVICGAIGVSGLSEDEDEDFARLGLAALVAASGA